MQFKTLVPNTVLHAAICVEVATTTLRSKSSALGVLIQMQSQMEALTLVADARLASNSKWMITVLLCHLRDAKGFPTIIRYVLTGSTRVVLSATPVQTIAFHVKW